MRKLFFILMPCLFYLTSQAQTLDLPLYDHFIPLNQEEVVKAYQGVLDYGSIVKDKAPSDSMLKGRNDAFQYLQSKRRFGYYLMVQFFPANISYQIIEIPFARTQVFQLEKQFRLMLLDSAGLVSDYNIKGPKENYKYDSSCRCIYLEKKKLDKGIYVLEKGNQFLVFKQNQVSSGSAGSRTVYRARFSFRRFFSRLFSWKMRGIGYSQSGFALTNQAEYKHLDSFYAKAYMLDRKGNPFTGKVDVIIQNTHGGYKHFYLKTEAISYGPGSYGYEWSIPDSLALDQHYTILFHARKKSAIQESVLFKVTHYQLKNYKLEAKQTSQYLFPNDSSYITLSALDQNEIPITGTKVTMTYSVNGFGLAHQSFLSLAKTVQSNLYDTSFYLEPQKITYIPVTRAMLPNIDSRLSVNITMITPNNDRQSFQLSFGKADLIEAYQFDPKGQSLVANYYRNEKVTPSDTVVLEFIDRYFSESRKIFTTLPYTIENPSRYLNIYLRDTLGRSLYSISPSYQQVSIFSEKTNDSLKFELANTSGKSVFWELYFKGKRLDQGNSTSYTRALKGDEPAVLLLFYPQGNQLSALQQSITAKTGNLKIIPTLEEKSYPGQKLRAEYQILDFENKPVKGANITAFAVNTQMPVLPNPTIPYLGKDKYGSLKFKQYTVNAAYRNPSFIMAQDSAGYYQYGLGRYVHYRMYFNPEGITEYRSKSEQGLSQFQVRVMEGVNFTIPKEIWVDGKLAYVQVHANPAAEPFQIKPGKHKIEIRTQQFMLNLDTIEVKKGEKLSLGVNVKYLINTSNLNYREVKSTYEASELDQLDDHLLWFNPGNYYAGSYIRQGDRLYSLSQTQSQNIDKNNYGRKPYFCAGPLQEGIVEFMHPDTSFSFYYRPDQVFYQHTRLEIDSKRNTLFSNIYSNSTQNYFLDEEVLLPDTVLRRWFIQDSLSKLRKDVQVQRAMQTDNPQFNLFTNYQFDNRYLQSSSISLQDSASSLRQMNYFWMFNLDSLVYSRCYNTNPLGTFELVPGRYKLYFGNYLKNEYVIDEVVIDTNTLNFARLDLLKRPLGKEEKQAASYTYFKLIQDYGKDKPVYFDIELGESNSPGQNSKAEVNGWVNQHFRASYNAYVLFFSRDGKNKYLAKTNSQGYFSYFDMEPGQYYTQVITPGRELYFGGMVELKAKRLSSFNFNCVDPAKEQPKQYADRFAEPFSKFKHSYTSIRGSKSNLDARIIGKNGEAISYVAVTLIDSKDVTHLAISDDEGRIHKEGLAPGKYRMFIRMVGYETKSIKDIELLAGQNLIMEVVLQESVEVLAEVAVKERLDDQVFHSYASPGTYNLDVQENLSVDEVQVVRSRASRSKRSDGTAYYVNGQRISGSVSNSYSWNFGDLTGDVEIGYENEKKRLKEIRQDEDANRIRDNFKTTAYWFPHLITDRQGKIGFSYKNPDDETSWLHYALAIDKKRNTGLNKLYTQSYKPLSAALKVPEHVVAGDTLYFKPQIRNLTGDTIAVSTVFSIDSITKTDQISLGTYYRTSAYHVFQNADDSSTITYALDYDGYKDGERRKLPVLSNKTPFRVSKTFLLDRDQNITFNLSDSAKRRIVRIKSGIVDLIQQEIDDLRHYHYGCTEQTASKLIAMVRSKQLKNAIGEAFDGEHEIIALIDRLEDFQSHAGGFGWYKNSAYDMKLTLYAAQALHLASEAGYSTKAHKRAAGVLINSLKTLTSDQALSVLVLASKLDMRYDFKTEIQKYDRYNLPLQSAMTLMELKQLHHQKVDLKPLLDALKKDNRGFFFLDGDSKWGFNSQVLDLTLQGYRILKAAGGHGDKLAAMRKFVFANLKNSNHNTFEKANIINTLVEEAKEANTALFKVQVGERSYTNEISFQANGGNLSIKNSGEQVSIVVVEEYEDLNGRVQSSGLSLETKLYNALGKECTRAQAGEFYKLRVTVNSHEFRKYVIVNVPLPSGFVVLEKPERMSGESGREYFPDHIRIYHEQYWKGYHTYEFVLLPQFGGNFQILPSRAEDMYDPSYYGCSGKLRIEVEE